MERSDQSLPRGLLLSVSGARGIVGKSLDVEVATRLTLAFCSVLPPGPVVIGRDTRPSGEALKCAAMGAIMAVGHECIDLGIATTPTIGLMVDKLGAAGGIVVSASHNPVEWNALKFLGKGGLFISARKSGELRRALAENAFQQVDALSCGGLRNYQEATRRHIDAILSLGEIDISLVRERSFAVALDCTNGAGSVVALELLRELGARVIELDCKLDGDFRRDPEPRPENLAELSRLVKREKADIGFALDPDADRLSLVDERGKAVSEEFTMPLAADHVLSRRKGVVVANLSTSSLIDNVAAKHSSQVIRTPVGEAYVVEEMRRQGAVVGGEGNGGVIFPPLHPGRDALLAMALILDFLAEGGRTLSAQLASYPALAMAKEKVPLRGDFATDRILGLVEQLKPDKIDSRDGVKAIFGDGWFHIRVSNTEGVVRIIAEAQQEGRTDELATSARRVLEDSWG